METGNEAILLHACTCKKSSNVLVSAPDPGAETETTNVLASGFAVGGRLVEFLHSFQ